MSFAGTRAMSAPKKLQTKLSTWTPLNHQLSNSNIFEERRLLLRKWFDKWTDGQRKLVLQDFLSRSSPGQLRQLKESLGSLVPEQVLDFTVVLPRVLSLYIFSFLDPRSLCRCAQVSWHWKSIVELDQVWMPKCLRLDWCIDFTPTPFEQGVWKRHYIETVKDLHVSKPKTPVKDEFVVPDVRAVGQEEEPPSSDDKPRDTRCRRGVAGHSSVVGTLTGLPPWRHADRHPTDTIRFNYLENPDPIQQARLAHATDTIRFNYLENPDPIEQARLARAKGKRVHLSMARQDSGTNKKKALSASAYKLRKAKSLMFLSLDLQSRERRRPDWAVRSADQCPVDKDTAEQLAHSAQWNAGIRPGPVYPPVPRLSAEGLRASLRSQRSSPTVPLFEERPWRIPSSRDSQEG